MEKIVLGGGCFWCLDASFRMIRGVTEVVSGYAGGETENPTYEQVCYEDTGHAEVVEVTFDPQTISLKQILEVFFALHDPTSLNRQGADVGTQYRSAIYYYSEDQQTIIQEVLDQVKELWEDKIVTEVTPLNIFYPAEEYHQDYFNKNPAAGYCQAVINPKLEKLREKYSNLLA